MKIHPSVVTGRCYRARVVRERPCRALRTMPSYSSSGAVGRGSGTYVAVYSSRARLYVHP